MQSSSSFSRFAPRSLLSLSPSPELSIVHEAVIASSSSVQRFQVASVPGVTALSRVASYPRRSVEFGVPPRPVASALRCLNARAVASASVSKRPVASAFVGTPLRCVASALQSSPRVASPRVVLAPAVQVWRRAAAAKMSMRIARRLASLAAGRPRQQLH